MDKLREIYRYRKRHIVFSNDDDINEIADINMFTPEIAEENELIDELIKSINDLEVSAQQIIFLRFHKGLTYKEIAKILSVTESNVKIIFFRAKNLSIKSLRTIFRRLTYG